MLFNEPKLLKSFGLPYERVIAQSFSALQRAEIAEIEDARELGAVRFNDGFSALQRAEIAEIIRCCPSSP